MDKKLKLKDVPDGRILKPGRETREQIPAICGECYKKGGKQVWVRTWRDCIDERRTARGIERIYVIEKCKCPDCGAKHRMRAQNFRGPRPEPGIGGFYCGALIEGS